MSKKYRSIGLAALVAGPGFNNKKGNAEVQKYMRNAAKAIDIYSKKWDEEARLFIDSIPSTSSVNPSVYGMTAQHLFVEENMLSSHPFFYSNNSPLTIYEALEEMRVDSNNIKRNLEDLQSDLNKVASLDVKRTFSLLEDTPNSYFHNQFLKVKTDESGLEATDILVAANSFVSLSDVPDLYTDAAGHVVTTLSNQSGVEFLSEIMYRAWGDSGAVFANTSHTLYLYDLSGTILILDRDVSLVNEIILSDSFDGAEVIIRNNDPAAAGLANVEVKGESGNTTVESEPLILGDNNKFVHLYYESSASEWRILGYE